MSDTTGLPPGAWLRVTDERSRRPDPRELERAVFELQVAARAQAALTESDGLRGDRPEPLTRLLAFGAIFSALLTVALVVELLRM